MFRDLFVEVRQDYLPMEKDTAKRSKGQIQVMMSSDCLGALRVLSGFLLTAKDAKVK